MINKYTGITLILLAVLSIIASWMIYKKNTKNFYVSPNNSLNSQQLIRDIQIKPAAFNSLKVMNDVIDTFSNTQEPTEDNQSIALSPIKGKQKRTIVEMPSDKNKQKRIAANICWNARKMKVSMSFVTSEDKYAVIADKFVREGETVGNKYKVISITTDKVKLKKRGVNCIVKVSGIKKSVAIH